MSEYLLFSHQNQKIYLIKMLEVTHFEEKPSPEDERKKPLTPITFVGLLNSFDNARALLHKLKENGSIDILAVKDDMIELRDRMFQILLFVSSIVNTYKDGFLVRDKSLSCDFCPDTAHAYRDFHVWCEFCFKKEYGGK